MISNLSLKNIFSMVPKIAYDFQIHNFFKAHVIVDAYWPVLTCHLCF